MRNPNRIEPFLKEFQKLWEKHPDMRFGQLYMNLECKILNRKKEQLDCWNTEEEEWLSVIKEGFKKHDAN